VTNLENVVDYKQKYLVPTIEKKTSKEARRNATQRS